MEPEDPRTGAEEEEDYSFEVDDEPVSEPEPPAPEPEAAPAPEPEAAPASEPEATPAPEPAPPRVDRVRDFFRGLDGLVQEIARLGPTVDRESEAAKKAYGRAREMVADGPVQVRVSPFGLLFEAEQVHVGKGARPAYLARLFEDGVRKLRFGENAATADVWSLASILATPEPSVDGDLVTRIWAKGLRTVDFDAARFGKGAAPTAGDPASIRDDDPRSVDLRRLPWARGSKVPGRCAPDDESAVFQVRTSFVDSGYATRFVEHVLGSEERTSAFLEMFDLLAVRGAVGAVSRGIDAVSRKAAAGGEAGALRDSLVEDARLRSLTPLVDRHPDALLRRLRALCGDRHEPLRRLLGRLGRAEVRLRLRDLLIEDGIDLTDFYSARVASSDPKTVIEAVQGLGAVGSAEAVKAMVPALSSESTEVRRAALVAVGERYRVELRDGLGAALADPDRDNRLLALKILRGSGDSKAAALILDVVMGPGFVHRGPTERRELCAALAAFKDRRALETFSSVLDQKNLLRSETTTDSQLAAVQALSAMGTPEAIRTLRLTAKRWYLPKPVREAAEASYEHSRREGPS